MATRPSPTAWTRVASDSGQLPSRPVFRAESRVLRAEDAKEVYGNELTRIGSPYRVGLCHWHGISAGGVAPDLGSAANKLRSPTKEVPNGPDDGPAISGSPGWATKMLIAMSDQHAAELSRPAA
jgi:hypothetical protein